MPVRTQALKPAVGKGVTAAGIPERRLSRLDGEVPPDAWTLAQDAGTPILPLVEGERQDLSHCQLKMGLFLVQVENRSSYSGIHLKYVFLVI